jgi:hypothetical protein
VYAEFDCPLGHPPGRIPIEDDIRQWGRCDDLDGVLVEVGGSRRWALNTE